MKTVDCIAFALKTFENLRFWEVEELKSLTVLLLFLKTIENVRFWEVEEANSLTVLILCLKTYENFRFWEVEEHHAEVLDTSGPAKLCWHMVRWLQDGCRASKPMMGQVLRYQGQQTCVGVHGIQRRFFGEAKRRFWIPGQTLNDN